MPIPIRLRRTAGALLLAACSATFATAAAAQDTPPVPADTTDDGPPVPSPLMLELSLGPVGIAGGGAMRSGLGLFVGAGWFGRDGRGGWRVGLTGSGADIGGPLPADVNRGLVRTRNTTAITAERVRRWHRPGRAATVSLGAGLGNQNADLERDRARPDARASVNGWAPAVSAATDVAFSVPATAPGVQVAPLDLTIGLRATALVGAPRVSDVVPVSGPVIAPRGIATMVALTIGVRFGALGEFFALLP